jgi:hypothetical protein
MKKTLLAVFVGLMLIIGCGGGGGSDSTATQPSGWTGPVNTQGYPDVEGRYTFNTTKFTAICTDGSTGSQNALSQHVAIQQNVNALTFYELTPQETIIREDEQTTGNVDATGHFIAGRTMIAYIAGVLGKNTVIYNFVGAFTADGWSGILKMSVYNDYIKGGCTYQANFAGNQFSSELQ